MVYSISCKSFCDSNGDGIGGLRGVMSKLPVLMYTRSCEKQTLLVIANKSNLPAKAELPAELRGKWKRLLSNRSETTPSLEGGRDWLPWETEIYVKEKD